MGDTAAAAPARRFGRICVFCGSNSGNRPVFGDAALELGQGLVTRGIDLVYGGGSVGLMGLIAQTVLDGGCRVLGVIPRALMPLEISGASVGEVKIVSDMHERKAEMARQSDAFIALPGGYGTMEELLEMITWSQLGIHDKPVGLLNVDGYYDPLLALFDKGAAEGFIKADCRQIIVSAPTAHELLTKMDHPHCKRPQSFRVAAGSPPPRDMAGVEEDAGMDEVQRRLMFDDECILVDEQDNVVGHESKYTCHLMEKIESLNLLHRAFSVFLFNSKHELLLQQRSATKITFPLVWTNTCCSHPLYRESELIQENFLGVRNAAQRKLLDELGIPAEDVPVDQFTPLGRMLYKAPSDGKWGEHELDYLLFIVREVKVLPNPDEVADVKYVSREQLQELIRQADAGEGGVKLSPWFRLVVDNFLMGWWEHLEKGTLEQAVDMETIHKLK